MTAVDGDSPNEVHGLPDCPEVALFIAGVFQRLGGWLAIDGNGERYAGRPESPSVTRPDGRPQLPNARPSEQFHNDDEWLGAIKLANYWLSRLSSSDRDYVFMLCAGVSGDPRESFDFRAHPKA